MKRSVVLFLSLLLLATTLAAAASEVLLKSRRFTPPPGTEALSRAEGADGEGGHFFVQLPVHADEELRGGLAESGVELLGYIPENTWIASFDARAIADTDLRSSFVWVGEILATDKMPPRLQAGEFGTWALQPDGRYEFRIRFHDDVDVEAAGSLLRALGAELVAPFGIFRGYTILAPMELVPILADLDEVMWITEGLPEPAIQNDGSRATSGAETLQEPPYDLTGDAVYVAIWDAGLVDENHDDFAGRLILGEGGGVHDHSTHVAGTVGGSGALSEAHGGTPLQWRGMAPESILFSWNFSGDVPQEIFDGIYTYELDLETNSWNWGVNGGNCYLYGNYDNWAPEFDDLVAGAAGRAINIQFSAANERDDGDCTLIEGQYACIPPPATAKNVTTVGATNSDDDTITGFSSFGPVDDGRLKPDVSAPGCEHYGEGGIRSTVPGDTYGLKCGTSMAAPTVTGNLAVLGELYNVENAGADPEPSLMKALLCATGLDLGNPGPDYAFGHGRIDSQAAADALMHDSQAVLAVSNGDNHQVSFPVPEGTDVIRLVLVWNDVPGNPMADPALVNDLDLVLIDPNGGEHYPWILDPDSPSQNATRGPDHLNNVEHVQVDDPIPGTWYARITGTNVPEGPQTTSLVGFDVNAPGAPIDFGVAAEGETSISLIWTNATAGDRNGTIIARWEGISEWPGPDAGASYTVGQIVAPGTEIIYVADLDHSLLPFVDTDLTPGHTYGYAAYTFDDMHNFSVAATASGTAGDPAAAEEGGAVPVLALGPAQPNPARNHTTFSFTLPGDAFVAVRLYDSSGRLVRTLLDAPMSAGTYYAHWNGTDDAGRRVAPGMYYYELRANGERLSKQVSWLR